MFVDRRQNYDYFDAYQKNGMAEPMVRMVGGYLEERLAQMVQMLRERMRRAAVPT